MTNQSKPTTANTWLPLFSGFYSTIWTPDESQFLYDNGLMSDDITFDNEAYENAVGEACCHEFTTQMEGYINSITFEGIHSPKYYNFGNDSINCVIDYKAYEVQRYCIDNFDKLEDYVRLQYTSYDGFISHYPNSAEGWQELTNNFIDLEKHTLGAILQFIALSEGITEFDIYDQVVCNHGLFVEDYITINETESDSSIQPF